MPELPEVETIRKVLERKLAGRRILRAEVRKPRTPGSRLTRGLSGLQIDLAGCLRGRKLKSVRRRAKYLLLEFGPATSKVTVAIRDEGHGDVAGCRLPNRPGVRGRLVGPRARSLKALPSLAGGLHGTLLVHLGMTGQLFAAPAGRRPCCDLPMLPDQHTHLVVDFEGRQRLYFRDIRKFGSLRWLRDRCEEQTAFAALGPEPLEGEFTSRSLAAGLAGKQAAIKALLLNQKLVAGLGNIYADEALFRAGIAPQARAGSLSLRRIARLHAAIREVLAEAIRFRGTTMSDYFDPESRRGGFQARLRVYGREGEPCVQCGRPISKGVVAQRGTHWCSRCQPGGGQKQQKKRAGGFSGK